MRYQLVPILISNLIPGIFASGALDCFAPGKRFVGDAEAGTQESDMGQIESLSKDHVLTKVVGCQFGNGAASSLQVFYGVWANGQVTDEVGLNRFGVTTSDCNTLEVSEGDAIKKVSLRYGAEAVSQVGFVTQNGDFMAAGQPGRNDLPTPKEYAFNRESEYAFYGLIGTHEGRVSSLSVIRYDKACLEGEKARLGNNFSWDGSSSGSSGSSTNSGSSAGSGSTRPASTDGSSGNNNFDPLSTSEGGGGSLEKEEKGGLDMDALLSNQKVMVAVGCGAVVLVLSLLVICLVCCCSGKKHGRQVEAVQSLD